MDRLLRGLPTFPIFSLCFLSWRSALDFGPLHALTYLLKFCLMTGDSIKTPTTLDNATHTINPSIRCPGDLFEDFSLALSPSSQGKKFTTFAIFRKKDFLKAL